MITRALLFVTALAVLLVTGLSAVAALAAEADAQQPDGPSFDNIDEHFKYGSVGTEERAGLPYWIWRVLPQLFEDKLPKRPGIGYERIGFISEAGRRPDSRPIGTSFLPGRFARVGLNC